MKEKVNQEERFYKQINKLFELNKYGPKSTAEEFYNSYF